MQNPSLLVGVAESWDWIHYLVESDIVDMEFRGHEDDNATARTVSLPILHTFSNRRLINSVY